MHLLEMFQMFQKIVLKQLTTVNSIENCGKTVIEYKLVSLSVAL